MVRRKTDPKHGSRIEVGENEKAKPEAMADKRNRKPRKPLRALQEIKRLRRTTNLLIPKAPFARLVREIMFDLFPRSDITRVQSSALEALQEAIEMYMVQFFEDASILSLHGNRVTLMRQDIILLRRLRGRDDIINR